MPDILPYPKTQIDAVIVHDEGGWKLTHNANDPDGGWTYAGVTHSTFNAYWKKKYPGSNRDMVFNDVLAILNGDVEGQKELDDDVYQIYFNEYYEPVAKYMNQDVMSTAMLSCAVNIGVDNAKKIWDACLASPDRLTNDKAFSVFLREWTRYYIHLVRDNSHKWQQYALVLEDDHPSSLPTDLRPKVFRAGDLEGWFNRVERYRS